MTPKAREGAQRVEGLGGIGREKRPDDWGHLMPVMVAEFSPWIRGEERLRHEPVEEAVNTPGLIDHTAMRYLRGDMMEPGGQGGL
jgi:hypothetical protein